MLGGGGGDEALLAGEMAVLRSVQKRQASLVQEASALAKKWRRHLKRKKASALRRFVRRNAAPLPVIYEGNEAHDWTGNQLL
jgi:hypothetical protein